MPNAATAHLEPSALNTTQWVELIKGKDAAIGHLQQQIDVLRHQVEWFKRQLFGSKSERMPGEPDPSQLPLAAFMDQPATATPTTTRTVPAHTRRTPLRDFASDGDSGLFFDESKVPVQTITLPAPAIAGLSPEQYTVIGEKVSHRLAQRPGSYMVLKYVRPLVKINNAAPTCAPAPTGVIEGSRADVSFQAGLLVDKFVWHLPLYRQHQRLEQAGIRVSRPWLTQLAQASIALLRPVYEAQFDSIRSSRVLAMDETPIKAGAAKGKMKQGYFWPVYGEQAEVCFPYYASRAHDNVRKALGTALRDGAVLLSDGYAAYARYAEQLGATHAQCWAHTRRKFFEAQDADPDAARAALERIGALYAVEEAIRDKKLGGEDKLKHRFEHGRPKVDAFFQWVEEQFRRQGLLPSNPFTQALAYARERRAGLEVFLADPDVPIDTNHLERALRAIPMGRKAWLFCWTELGAEQVGIVQSLLVTCRLHGIDPYTYLVDVLQRVGQHPASRVAELTPRLWKGKFAADPLRSDVHKVMG